jgi:N-acetylmuramoyl-L-alanine amidase
MAHSIRIPQTFLALCLLCATPTAAQTVCVDPGHGGADPGAVGCGLEEAAVNLDTGLRLRDLLATAGYSVLLTRENDVAVGLVARAEYANSNGADRFVSIHANSAGVVASGIETYCANNASAQSFDLRDRIQAEMIATWPLPDRGGKTANYTVLTATAMPATLSELGFINNCDIDAVYLADPAERERAAAAHLRAIQAHFGDEPVEVGVLRGVVFEDQGVGFEDMSVRLPGALVTLLDTGDNRTAAAPDADWRFDLAPGSYTVRATLAGYQPAERSCDVIANQTSWCSLGLLPESAPDGGVDGGRDGGGGLDADGGTGDAGADSGMDGGTDAGGDSSDHDDGGADGGDDPPDADADAGFDAGGEPGADPRLGGGDGGCGCAARGSQPMGPAGLLAALLLAGALRRRRCSPDRRRTRREPGGRTAAHHGKAAVSGLLALLGLLLLTTGAVAGESRRLEPQAAFARLGAERIIASGFVGPVLAPDGRRLVFSAPGYHSLWLAGLDGGASRRLSTRPRAGLRPVWRADSKAIGLRPAQQPYGPRPPVLIDLNGRDRGPLRSSGPRAVQRDDRVWLRDSAGARAVSPPGVRAFAPVLSRDGRWLVYCSLGRGLWLERLTDGTVYRLGPGVQPAFAAGSRWLVFARPRDDGQRVTGSELLLVDLQPPVPRLAPLTRTPERTELHPSLSADGDLIAYWVDGRIAVARMYHD